MCDQYKFIRLMCFTYTTPKVSRGVFRSARIFLSLVPSFESAITRDIFSTCPSFIEPNMSLYLHVFGRGRVRKKEGGRRRRGEGGGEKEGGRME